jgi:DNA-binding transcriptional LysR family regulator
MQDLNSTKLFVRVVVAGSFTKAASTLGIPKSTVSDKVAQLEKELGVTLLTRTTRKLALTDVGAEFFRKAEQGISQLQAAGEEASQSQKAPTGVLRLTAPAEILVINSMINAVAEYKNKFPNVKVEVDFSDRYVDLVAEGYDVAIRAGDLEDSSLMAKRVGFAQLFLVASESYLRKAPPLKHPKDLRNHICLKHIEPPSDDIWFLRTKQGKTAKIQITHSTASNAYPALKALALLGQGIVLLPNSMCRTELSEKKLVRVLPEWATSEVPVHLVYPAQRFSSPKIKEMIPLLEKHLREIMDVRGLGA